METSFSEFENRNGDCEPYFISQVNGFGVHRNQNWCCTESKMILLNDLCMFYHSSFLKKSDIFQ